MAILPENMSLQWLGHSSCSIKTCEGLRVLIDPWLGRRFCQGSRFRNRR